MYNEEQTITPDHDIDLDERLTPTNSVTGESEDGGVFPGPNPDLFAKSASIRTARPGSMNHYMEWAQEAGLQADQDATADLYGQTHGVNGYDLLDKFKSQRGASIHTAGDCDYCGKSGHSWKAHPEAVREVEQAQNERHREEFPFGDYQPGEVVPEDFDGYEHFASRTAAGAWGDVDVEGGEYGGGGGHKPGSAGHYLEYAHRNGLHPGDDMTADRYAREHKVPIANASNLAGQFGITGSIHEAYPGKHRKAPEPEYVLPNEAEVWDAEDWLAAHPEPKFSDPREQARYEEWKKKTLRGDTEIGDRFINPYETEYEDQLVHASLRLAGGDREYLEWCRENGRRPESKGAQHDYYLDMSPTPDFADLDLGGERVAGLSDKYIDLPVHQAAANDPVSQFRTDPVTFIQRTAYLIESATGLDPRVGQYMDLVEADPMIRQAAWNDVREKAMRLRREGAVQVKDIAPNRIYASVTGDHGVYNVYVYKGASLTGSNSIDQWHCGCEWGKWAFKRKHTFVGRLCSHGLAAYFTMQSAHQTGSPRQQKLPKRKKPTRSLPIVSPSSRSRHSQKLAYDEHLLGPDGKLPYETFLQVHNISPDHPKAKDWYQQEVSGGSGGDIPQRAKSLEDYYAGLPRPSDELADSLRGKFGPSHYLDYLDRTGSVLDDYKSWVSDVNMGVVDVPSADAYMSQLDEQPDAEEAKKVYDYVYDNFTERPQRNYDVDGYTFDPDKVWDGGNGHDNDALRSQGKPDRLSPDLYRVPDGEEQKSIDVEKDERKTTGPDQITAKVDKKWAEDHADKDDEHEPIVHFSMRKEALTYTADEGLLTKLRELSAEPASENLGNMKERNREVAEVVQELRDRGYDASLFVAMRREANDTLDGIVDFMTYGPGGNDKKREQANPVDQYGLPGKGRDEQPVAAIPNRSGLGSGPDPALAEVKGTATSVNNVTPAAGAGGDSSGGGGGAAGDGGGSDWTPNGIKDPIGAGDYKIQSGDTLTSISERSGVGIDDLMSGNSQITNKDLIFADDNMKIPGSPAAGGEAPAPAAAEVGGEAPAAPPPAGADSTSGAPAPDIGPPNSTGFAPPTTPNLTVSSRYFYAEEDDDPTKKLNIDQNSSLFGTSAGGAEADAKAPAAAAAPAAPAAKAAPAAAAPAASTEQIMTPNFNNKPPVQTAEPSDGSKRLEDQAPSGAVNTGDGGIGSVMPILEGLGGAVMPLVTQTLGPLASGIGSAIGNGLSGLFTASSEVADGDDAQLSNFDDGSSAIDPAFAGSGPSRKDWFSTSEEWHNHHDYIDLLDEPEGDLISYKTQPKQAAHEWDEKSVKEWVKRHDPNFRDDEKEEINFVRKDDDDSDIVRQFQANIGNTALGSGAGGGGSYSDDAIAQAAQGFLRTAGRVYSLAEQQELMDETHPKGARNLPGLDLTGTHYLEG